MGHASIWVFTGGVWVGDRYGFGGVAVDDTDKLLDLAEFKALENGLGNFDATDISVGPRSESYDQIRAGLEKILGRKQANITRLYGFGLGTLEAGVIAYDFMAKATDTLT